MKYLVEYVRLQVLELVRLPSFLLPMATFPVLFYLTVGLRTEQPAINTLYNYAAFAMLGTAMFQFGVGIAANRNDPWNAYLLSLPASPRQRIAAQLLAGIVFAALFALPFAVIGLLFGAFATATPTALLLGLLALIAGALVHGCLGLALGYWLPARGALPIANLIYFPLSFLGGLFGPVDFGSLQTLHTWSPTGAWSDLIASGLGSNISWLALGILAGYFVICTTAAIIGYRRVQETIYR